MFSLSSNTLHYLPANDQVRNQKPGGQNHRLTWEGSPRLRVAFCAIVFLMMPAMLSSQQAQWMYKIARDGKQIGWMKLQKTDSANRMMLSLNSEVKTRFVFDIAIDVTDLATFEEGKLVHSATIRRTNNRTKLDKQTRRLGTKYEISQEGKTRLQSFPVIHANLLSMYFFEPAGLQEIYSDMHERFIPVKRIKEGSYEVKFPDGNSNVFFYAGGLCTRIKIKHSFYTAEILLNTKG